MRLNYLPFSRLAKDKSTRPATKSSRMYIPLSLFWSLFGLVCGLYFLHEGKGLLSILMLLTCACQLFIAWVSWRFKSSENI